MPFQLVWIGTRIERETKQLLICTTRDRYTDAKLNAVPKRLRRHVWIHGARSVEHFVLPFQRRLDSLLDAVRLRSDVERKRSAGLAATDRPRDAGDEARLYSEDSSRRTYRRLADLAEPRPQLVDGLLAHATGVHHDQVGLGLAGGRLVAVGFEQAGDALAVVVVHLAPERLDHELTRHDSPSLSPADDFRFRLSLFLLVSPWRDREVPARSP